MTISFIRPLSLLASMLSAASIASSAFAQGQEDKYAGVWNYDQPNSSTEVNIGTIRCPATLKGSNEFMLVVPQVGNLTLTRKEEGRLQGRTDQGCTWTFRENGTSAELDPVPQDCFNKVIGSSYTMVHWTFRVDGNHQTESIEATSHLPMGSCDFVLKDGSRTKADDSDSAVLFVGVWQYDAPNVLTHSNILQFMDKGESGPSGHGESPETGAVTFSKTGDHALTARTADGCTWALDVHGNTALLPSPQTCALAASNVTINHWSIASDGEHQSTVMNVTQQDAAGRIRLLLLGAGSLTRQTPQ
jgi:hypothetical protein